MNRETQKRGAALCLLATAMALTIVGAGGCGSGQAGQDGPPISDAQREQVRTTGTVLPPPSQPETKRHTRDAAAQ